MFFPEDSTTVQDSPRLTLIVLDPDEEWINGNQVVERIGQWTQERGTSPRLYPGSLVKIIDLGAGHASASETLCGRIISALKSEALLNENVGAGYIDRHWPPIFKDTGAWPLTSLRQSFLNGALTRLIDPDAVLLQKVVEFVANGEFGLASGAKDDGGFNRLWYEEPVAAEEVAFEGKRLLGDQSQSPRTQSRT